MTWAEVIMQCMATGSLGVGGYKLTDLFLIRKPKQVSDINKQLREELRQENKELKGIIAEQEDQINELRNALITYKLDTLTILTMRGVAPEIIEAVINP